MSVVEVDLGEPLGEEPTVIYVPRRGRVTRQERAERAPASAPQVERVERPTPPRRGWQNLPNEVFGTFARLGKVYREDPVTTARPERRWAR